MATFSKGAAADVVFTIMAATGATLTALKNGGATVNQNNYSYSNGTLTINAGYLSGLANGNKSLTLSMSLGSDLVAIITVTN